MIAFVAQDRNGCIATITIRPAGDRWEVAVHADGGHALRICRTRANATRTALAVRDRLIRKGI